MIDDLKTRLANTNARSSQVPWTTTTTLTLIATNPGKRAAEPAGSAGMETRRFKTNVRKLKELGLPTENVICMRYSGR